MLRHYFVIAYRNFIRQPGYSALNVLGLTIGLTGCMLILIYIQYELSYDRFFDHADRVYRLVNGNNARTSAALAHPLRSIPEVSGLVRLGPPGGVWMMQHEDQVFYEKLVYWTDESLFDVLSFSLIQGNPETALRAPSTVVITQETARKYFGDENPMGKVIRGDDRMDLRYGLWIHRNDGDDTEGRTQFFKGICFRRRWSRHAQRSSGEAIGVGYAGGGCEPFYLKKS